MLTLSLLRHAKSSWDDGSIEDFERPLAKRGESAAPRMGAFMAEHDLAPQLILCSIMMTLTLRGVTTCFSLLS